MLATILFLTTHAAHLGGPADIVLANFDGGDYGKWVAQGDAFGSGPARGAFRDQMAVSGFVGGGLVNTFRGGDGATGTLTSPAFKIERRYLRFLIGGGKDPQNLAINLLINGKVVRSMTGPNDRAGGSEALAPAGWDVADLRGQSATIEIVDRATGGWGHINVDEIVESDSKPPMTVRNASRDILLNHHYLNLPVKNGAPKRWMTVDIPGEPRRRFDIELADDKPDFWVFIDVARDNGKTAHINVDELRDDSKALSSISVDNAIKGSRDLYREKLRPQFHFTARRGWLNDPNGLVFYKGEYHLFFQHNPYGWPWGNMSWGHAVSGDLVHWKELPVALDPDPMGTMFSGSAVVDWNNTAGFQKGDEKTLVAMYTAAGQPFTQGTAYSTDRGRTWTKYAGNPTVPFIVHENRDPKMIWYAPENKWVMALYLDGEEFALFSSKDLKHWERMSTVTIPGTSECPNFFPLLLDGNTKNQKWVFYGGNGGYLVGRFDGHTFTPEGERKEIQHGNCWYATQVYSDIPASDGRTILVPWGQIEFPGMPFNQMMGLPVELTLRTTEDGPTICSVPVRELRSLRTSHESFNDVDTLSLTPGELFEVETTIDGGTHGTVTFNVRGVPVTYNADKGEVSCLDRHAAIHPVNGKVNLHFLVDRTSIDIFGNDGRLYMPMGMLLKDTDRSLTLAKTGDSRISSVHVYRLKSSWR